MTKVIMNGQMVSTVAIALSITLYLTGRTVAQLWRRPVGVAASLGCSALIWLALLIVGLYMGFEGVAVIPVTTVFFFLGLISTRQPGTPARQLQEKPAAKPSGKIAPLGQTPAPHASSGSATVITPSHDLAITRPRSSASGTEPADQSCKQVAPGTSLVASGPEGRRTTSEDQVRLQVLPGTARPRSSAEPAPEIGAASALLPQATRVPGQPPPSARRDGPPAGSSIEVEFGETEITAQAQRVLDIVNHQNDCVFVTGRAGTGKSTLLRHLVDTTRKRVAVLAPTGIAAINVRGQTIHSFCGFPPRILNPREIHASGKGELCRRLDAIIIDEVSMVRADLMDSIDTFLRFNGKDSSKPFGGLQLIFFGDLLQLPPVVRREDQEYIGTRYPSPFFFEAQVFRQARMIVIELTKIYRQHDRRFIDILNGVRAGTLADCDLQELNRRSDPEFEPEDGDDYVCLVGTNAQADRTNRDRLALLPGIEHQFEGRIEGEFNQGDAPTDLVLHLKTGAQVMFVKNDPDRRWVNGTIGRISALTDKSVWVAIGASGPGIESSYEIQPETWESVRYVLDKDTQEVEPQVVGSFTQFPIRLAWAMTIHKSQGRTFDKAFVDFGRGAFADGQAYVALSRCRSLEGLKLKTPLRAHDIRVSRSALDFMLRNRQDGQAPVEGSAAGIAESPAQECMVLPSRSKPIAAPSNAAEAANAKSPDFSMVIGSASQVWIDPGGGTFRTDTGQQGRVDTAGLIRWLRTHGWVGGGSGRGEVYMWKEYR